jgi:hypothetical protein
MKRLVWLLLVGACFAQDLRRPISDADGGNNLSIGCTGSNTASASLPKGYDAAGLTTFSENDLTGTTKTLFATRIFSGWVKNSLVYSALTLNIFATSKGWRFFGGLTGNSAVAYSTDSGNTWTPVVADGGLSGGNGFGGLFTINLGATQDISQVRVGVCVQGLGTAKGQFFGTDDIEVYDIYTLGTQSSQPPGPGSTTGSPHRGMVVVN